jgi:hypothetical protein
MTIINRHDYTCEYAIVTERAVSGDLKGEIKGNEFHVDQSDDWLWDFERRDPECYARKMQKRGIIPIVKSPWPTL